MDSTVNHLSPSQLPARRVYSGRLPMTVVGLCLVFSLGCDKLRFYNPADVASEDGAVGDAGADDNQDDPTDPHAAARLSKATARFDHLFKMNCAGCHGADGQLGPAPPLNDPIFLAIVPDEELLHAIQHGRRGTPMPAFAKASGGSLTPAQVQVLADGIKRRWKAAETTPVNLPANLPAYAAAQDNAGSHDATLPSADAVSAGNKVFSWACAQCHGADGRGQRPDAAQPRAIHEPSFLALISDQALRRIIITGRPDLGMPNFAQSHGRPGDFQALTSQDITNLGALLASWRTAGSAIGGDPAPK